MFPATGSTMTAAMRLRVLTVRHPGHLRRCTWSTSVSLAVPAVTPGELGTPKVAAGHAGRHQQAVNVAMIVPCELDDRVPAGDSRGPGGSRSWWPRSRNSPAGLSRPKEPPR